MGRMSTMMLMGIPRGIADELDDSPMDDDYEEEYRECDGSH